jgi:tRNA 2-selenouridine synthase
MDENEFLEALKTGRDIIDVRSEAEFAEDHAPGAINLPVLNNAERAEVGTMYTRVSRFEARRRGASLVARNIARHIEQSLADRGGDFAPIVYCWRGGMRSGAMAHVLRQVGWRAETLEGGYRTYRRAVVKSLYEDEPAQNLIVLAGKTGCAKTELLGRVGSHGAQAIDLEALANHRGSLFGSLPDVVQPTQKWFESLLFWALSKFDTEAPVIVEDESSKIGRLLIPPGFWKAMCAAPRIHLSAGLNTRAGYLRRNYADIVNDPPRLQEILDHLTAAQGKEKVEGWRELAASGNFDRLAAELMEHHYDPSYSRSTARHSHRELERIDLGKMNDDDLDRAAERIAAAALKHKGDRSRPLSDQSVGSPAS